ncbi:MAG: hypothetical protein ACREOJ_00945 [Gemmatimonadaceae bacterium]
MLLGLFLPDLPAYRNGLVRIGLARHRDGAHWSAVASGSHELAAVRVAFNAVFQIRTSALLGWVFLAVAPGWLGGTAAAVCSSM